jgi:hypothetical protein
MSDFDYGQILPRPTGQNYDENFNYLVMHTCYDQYGSEWMSLVDNNKGHALPGYDANFKPIEDDWWRCTVNARIAYEKGEDAKAKGNTAQQQGNAAEAKGEAAKQQGNVAQEKGNAAAAAATLAALIGQNPPRVGCTIEGHASDDHYWYYAVPNEHLDGVTWVNSNVWAKGDNLDWESLSEAEKQRIIGEILASFAEVTEEDAAAIFADYIFQTTD